jgi:Uma2 family endonuclease
MNTAAQITIAEYLASTYEPDCDYVDGELEDRNVGEKDHSKVQFKVQLLLSAIAGLHIFPEVRIRVSESRYRVPDVAVYLDEPDEQVFTTPPYLVIEILSPEDRWSRVTRKLDDYAAMGCPNIWVLDALQRRAYRRGETGTSEVHDVLSTADARVTLRLTDIW